jgi:hypothetical protein
MLGCDWENVVTHALFSSNPAFVKSGFWPVGLKRPEMLLGLVRPGCQVMLWKVRSMVVRMALSGRRVASLIEIRPD